MPKKILTIFGTIVFILILGEAMCVLNFNKNTPKYIISPKYKSIYISKFHPNRNITIWDISAKINNFSMRAKNITQLPIDGVYRILSYGDSIGFGIGVRDNQNYPYILEYMLNQPKTKRYEVLNMAVWCSPSIYYFHIQEDIQLFKPKMIIMEIELSNDISDEALINYDRINPDKIKTGRYSISWDNRQISSLNLGGYFFERTYLYALLSQKIGFLLSKYRNNPIFSSKSDIYYYNLGFERHILTQERLSLAFERMFHTIKKIKEICDDNKVEFLLVILPSKYYFYNNQYQNGALRMLKEAEEKSSALAIPFILPAENLKKNGGERLYYDFCHLSPDGYNVVAQELLNYIYRKRS